VRGELSVLWSELLAVETVAADVVEVFQDDVVVPEAMRSGCARSR
jgi:hypothetical protein